MSENVVSVVSLPTDTNILTVRPLTITAPITFSQYSTPITATSPASLSSVTLTSPSSSSITPPSTSTTTQDPPSPLSTNSTSIETSTWSTAPPFSSSAEPTVPTSSEFSTSDATVSSTSLTLTSSMSSSSLPTADPTPDTNTDTSTTEISPTSSDTSVSLLSPLPPSMLSSIFVINTSTPISTSTSNSTTVTTYPTTSSSTTTATTASCLYNSIRTANGTPVNQCCRAHGHTIFCMDLVQMNTTIYPTLNPTASSSSSTTTSIVMDPTLPATFHTVNDRRATVPFLHRSAAIRLHNPLLPRAWSPNTTNANAVLCVVVGLGVLSFLYFVYWCLCVRGQQSRIYRD